MSEKILTKSKYLAGLQCPKLLWIAVNDKSSMAEPTPMQQHIFTTGNEVGELAKEYFSDGIDIPQETIKGNIELAKEFLQKRVPLYESGIVDNILYSRPDILVPVEEDKWDIVEVKSGTEVKDVNIDDVSFQKYVYQNAGLKIRKCFLMHVNKQYIKNGPINVQEFFELDDISEEVEQAMVGLEARIAEMVSIINKDVCPEVEIGRHCKKGKKTYDCSVQHECWAKVPKESVFELYNDHRNRKEILYRRGLELLKDIPQDFDLTENQVIQRTCAIAQKPHIEKNEIRAFLENLVYPLYYLDFETITSGIPIYDQSRPYQHIPTQYSVHIVESPEAETKHVEYLANGNEDPRADLYKALKNDLGTNGSIIAYYHYFERDRIVELGEFVGDQEWADAMTLRLVDLIDPFRQFHYYHLDQKGSASIKDVLPVFSGVSYKDMEIGDGFTAVIEFTKIVKGEVSGKEEAKIRENLLKYCGLDTMAMALYQGHNI